MKYKKKKSNIQNYDTTRQKSGKYQVESRHISNMKGYVIVNADYWSISYGRVNNNQKTIGYTTYSSIAIINNNNFHKLMKQAIRNGLIVHNKRFNRSSDSTSTYSINWYKIIYQNQKNFKYKYNKKTMTTSIKITGKKSRKYKEDKKDFQGIRKDINNTFEEMRANREERTDNKSIYISRKEFNKMYDKY